MNKIELSEEYYEHFIKTCGSNCLDALEKLIIKKKQVKDLTSDEKFALAVINGVDFHIKEQNNNSYKMVTEKCAINWDGHKLTVVTT